MRTVIKGDFIGFSFNDVHSSELGIVRTSNGSRYDDNLLPTSQDKTAAVPGGDGTYYWDTFHTQKPFNIPIAFDSLTEEEYRELRNHFNTKKMGKLIFDETPYKYYMVKPTGNLQLKTICFDEGNQRIYKGEGTIQFTAFYPYAKSVKKWLDEYEELNKNEWSGASGMKNNDEDIFDKVGATIELYNPGDLEADFYLYFTFNDNFSMTSIQIGSEILKFNAITKESTDAGFRINTKTNLIEGIDANEELTGTLYNKYIKSGDFFKIPLGESQLVTTGTAPSAIEYEYIYY